MASAAASVHFELLVSRNAIREAQRKALRLFAGRGCRYSVKELQNATGVPEGDIENAMRPVHDPNFRALKQEQLASIAKFLGAEFASVYLGLSELGAFDLMEGEQPPLPRVLTADTPPVPRETKREKVERLHREYLDALEDLTA